MPEFQVTLSKRQHVRFDVGLRIPATNTAGSAKAGDVLSPVGLAGRKTARGLVMTIRTIAFGTAFGSGWVGGC